MSRRVVITGLGPVGGLGLGIEPTWRALREGQSAVAPVRAFDASAFGCAAAAEAPDFKINDFVPKSYRQDTKVMARDIELAVVAAELAAKDAGLVTKEGEGERTYPSERMAVHVGAGLIAAELNELTAALAEARDGGGHFDMHKWGREGMTHLTPLWLLKYLPNMLACHVSIIHAAHGPSNTITCAEASSGLSIGESLRVIQRGAADAGFCGGSESKLNPMAYLRQIMTGRYNTTDKGDPAKMVRPYCQTAAGGVVGEGGAIIVLEAVETFERRKGGGKAYAEVAGFGASQSVNPAQRNLSPDPQGKGMALAIRAALRKAGIDPQKINLVIGFGLGLAESDRAEAAALASVFGASLAQIPIRSTKSLAGNCGAGAGGLDVCAAVMALREQTIPAAINCDQPLAGLNAGSSPARPAKLEYVLTYNQSMGGQNAAVVLKRYDA